MRAEVAKVDPIVPLVHQTLTDALLQGLPAPITGVEKSRDVINNILQMK